MDKTFACIAALMLLTLFYFWKIRQKDRQKPQATGKVADYHEEPTEDDADFRLFTRLDRMIDEQQLYLNPNLNRDELCALVGVDKNRLGRILKQYSREMNLKAYINHKRMLFAVEQLRRHPEWTMLAIARSSGITNTATFNRIFRQNFGMSPTEYVKSTRQPADGQNGKHTTDILSSTGQSGKSTLTF